MSDKVPEGRVWLCRDKNGDSRQLIRVYSGLKPTRKPTISGGEWQIHYGNGVDSSLVKHIFGDIPGENEAWRVTRMESDLMCDGCDDWREPSDTMNVTERDGTHTVRCIFCNAELTKSRCRVLGAINLEDAK